MKGTTLLFRKQVEVGRDSFNNPINDIMHISVDDCLIAPITEPANAREQQAMQQSRDQVRIHIPKAFDGDVADSYVAWDDKVFRVDSDSVRFMTENTPTRWDRYFRAEHLGYGETEIIQLYGFFITEDSDDYLQQEGS